MGKGFAKRKKQFKAMQEQIAKMQNEMENIEIEGQAGNGLVTIILKGDHSIKKLSIKPDCVDPEDVEGLEDLIIAAYNDAKTKLEEQTSKGIPSLGGGFPDLSGLGF